MCGIIGAYGPSAHLLNAEIYEALDAISHRGPDGKGVYASADGQCILGHVRLAIIDLSDAAAQPMVKLDSALTYNGEIYNHNLLRAALDKFDAKFSSSSDTETLLVGLRQSGYKFLNFAKGMFAGAWYDERTKELLLFRDSLGIKPIYTARLADSTVLFASEIPGLLALSKHINRSVSGETLFSYLSFENFPQNETLFTGVDSLLPGEVRKYQIDTCEYRKVRN